MSRAALLVALPVLACAACGGGEPQGTADAPGPAAGGDAAPTTAYFAEAAADTGLDFVHWNGMTGGYYMAEVTGSGAALLDYDGDGDLDVYFVQGRLLGPGKSAGDAIFPTTLPTDRGRLYRNRLAEDGRLGFEDVSEEAVPPHTGYGMGVATGDYDGDGDPDLYLTHLGRNQLLRNEGDGTFRDVTDASGAGDDGWSVPAAFLDFDRDGDLDLFVGNYVDFPFDDPPVCNDFAGEQDYCGPDSFAPQADRLFENRGDGTFRDVTAERGLTGGFGPALGVVAADFDGDGWIDLYVANDQRPNNLWLNQGDGTLRDEALLAGAAMNAEGKAEASMGVDGGDFDGDGDLDLFMAHLVTETNTLYVNEGGGLFTDRSVEMGLAQPSKRFTGFGTSWLDYDNDGDLDLLVVNGEVDVIDELHRAGDPFPYEQPNQLFENLGDGRYREVTAEAGAPFQLSEVSRGALFGDLD
ncbi:MAG TPA: VCBS repeat-containing protein, partial [Thermoanaerobaculia bacterium]|nr:VCBS repeat-containing protein [Thermoanaerobaculia bacterium]